MDARLNVGHATHSVRRPRAASPTASRKSAAWMVVRMRSVLRRWARIACGSVGYAGAAAAAGARCEFIMLWAVRVWAGRTKPRGCARSDAHRTRVECGVPQRAAHMPHRPPRAPPQIVIRIPHHRNGGALPDYAVREREAEAHGEQRDAEVLRVPHGEARGGERAPGLVERVFGGVGELVGDAEKEEVRPGPQDGREET